MIREVAKSEPARAGGGGEPIETRGRGNRFRRSRETRREGHLPRADRDL